MMVILLETYMTNIPEQTDPRLRIIDLRNRVLRGEKLSNEEISEALSLLTKNRKKATAPRATKSAGEPLPTNLSDLFKK